MIINEKLKRQSRRFCRGILSPIFVIFAPPLVLLLGTYNSELIYEFMVYITYYYNSTFDELARILSLVMSCIAEGR